MEDQKKVINSNICQLQQPSQILNRKNSCVYSSKSKSKAFKIKTTKLPNDFFRSSSVTLQNKNNIKDSESPKLKVHKIFEKSNEVNAQINNQFNDCQQMPNYNDKQNKKNSYRIMTRRYSRFSSMKSNREQQSKLTVSINADINCKRQDKKTELNRNNLLCTFSKSLNDILKQQLVESLKIYRLGKKHCTGNYSLKPIQKQKYTIMNCENKSYKSQVINKQLNKKTIIYDNVKQSIVKQLNHKQTIQHRFCKNRKIIKIKSNSSVFSKQLSKTKKSLSPTQYREIYSNCPNLQLTLGLPSVSNCRKQILI